MKAIAPDRGCGLMGEAWGRFRRMPGGIDRCVLSASFRVPLTYTVTDVSAKPVVPRGRNGYSAVAMRCGKWPLSLIAVALVASALVAQPSAGARPVDPIAHIACGSNAAPGCSETGTDTLGANSYGSQQTDVVPNTATSATELVQPAPGSNLAAFDSVWETVVQGRPKLGHLTSIPVRRFIICHLFAQTGAALGQYANETIDTAENTYGSSYLLAMGACLSLVNAMQAEVAAQPLPPATDASASACNQTALALPVELSKVGRNLRFHVNATPVAAGNKGQLSVSCKRAGAGLLIGVRPKQRHARLGSVVGPHLQIGFANPGKVKASIRTTYTFH